MGQLITSIPRVLYRDMLCASANVLLNQLKYVYVRPFVYPLSFLSYDNYTYTYTPEQREFHSNLTFKADARGPVSKFSGKIYFGFSRGHNLRRN